MKVLDLFAGAKSVSSVFKKKGHEVFTVDILEELNPDLCIDILKLTPEIIIEKFGVPDVIWASPPCECFSVASIGKHWNKDNTPKSAGAELSVKLVEHALWLINELKPKYWFMENPRGKLRKLPVTENLPRYTVTYCQYGDERMKPTDIWTNHPNPKFKPICKNGDPCHVAAPRGSQTGTQGRKSYLEKSHIPEKLVEHIETITNE